MTSLNIRQRGIVSIIVTVVMMLVISLIVLGFAQLARREQQTNQDRRQSEQAFLAAESGINDARSKIAQYVASGAVIPAKDTCPTSPSSGSYRFNPKIDAVNKVEYTCMIIDPDLDDILADVPADGRSLTFPLEPAGGNMGRLQIRWSAKSAVTAGQLSNCFNGVPGSGALKSITSSDWNCPYGMLRLDIVPTDTLSRAAMEAGQRTMFIYPIEQSGTATQSYTTADGRIVPMNCTTTNCQLDITNLTAFDKYMVRVSSRYSGGDLRLVGLNAATNAEMGLRNAQVMIDVTGRAQDVLRRVQVRIPLTNSSPTVPDYAVSSASSICKRFNSTGTTLTDPGDIVGQDDNNPMCF